MIRCLRWLVARWSAPAGSVGAHGEWLAAEYLERQGARVSKRNLRARGGELDLVVECADGVLALVEVRARGAGARVGPIDSVGPAKRRRLLNAARALIRNEPRLAHRRLRFDMVSVDLSADPPRISWIQGLFEPGSMDL